jgi:hypothetical protein
MQRGPNMMVRALIAVGVLVVVGGSGAFADTCSSLNGPTLSPSSPAGDVFETSGPTGLLDGFGITYPTCSTGTAFFIPFYEAHAATVDLAIAGASSLSSPFTFTIASVAAGGPASTTANTDGSGDLTLTDVAVPAGLDTLAITDSALIGTGAVDDFGVSIQFQNFIPEPASLSLLGFGATCLIGLVRRRRQSA